MSRIIASANRVGAKQGQPFSFSYLGVIYSGPYSKLGLNQADICGIQRSLLVIYRTLKDLSLNLLSNLFEKSLFGEEVALSG